MISINKHLNKKFGTMFYRVLRLGSARPEVRGTAKPYGKAYHPPSTPPRTPTRHSSLSHGGRAGRDR